MSRSNQLYSGECVSRTRFASAASALAILSVTSALLPAQSVRAESGFAIEEVVVTARKKEETLQEVPVAVTVLTENSITAQRIEGIKDLGNVVPGLVTSRVPAGTAGNIYLRGVGTGATTPLVDQAVAINIDGVGVSSAQLMNAGMFDLEQIEVLRGPQALFYGKNSPGGVIAVHTKNPTDEFEAEVSGMYETETEQLSIRGIVSGPMSDTLGGRLSLGWSETDKHRFNVQNSDEFVTGPVGEQIQTAYSTSDSPVEMENVFVMGTLLWEPTDNLAATLKVAHLQDDQEGHGNFGFQRTNCGVGNTPQVVYPVSGVNNCKLDDNVQQGGLSPLLIAVDPHYSNHTGDGFFYNETNFASLDVRYDIGDSLTLTSVTGYLKNEEDRLSEAATQVAALLGNSREFELEQWSQEFRLNSAFNGPVNFTVGAYYEEKEIYSGNFVATISDFAFAPVVGVFGVPLGRHINEQDGVAYSVFGQVDWELAEQWTLSAGVRYSHEEKEGHVSVDNISAQVLDPLAPAVLLQSDVTLADDKPDWENFSPELTLSYFFDEDVMFFASYKTAFKSGGFDGGYKPITLYVNEGFGIADDNVYNEETVKGFEVGMKSTLLDGTLRVNLTAYSYEYKDLQLGKLDSSIVPSLKVVNVGAASVDGVELETLWVTPVEGLTLTANVAYGSSEYDEYVADCFTGQTVAMGCDDNFDAATGSFTGADMAGESLPNATDLSVTFGLDYMVAMGDKWELGLNVSTSYKDDYNPSSLLLPKEWQQDSYWWTNASVSLYSADDTWEFYARGVNLGDELYTTQKGTAPLSGNAALNGTTDPSGVADAFAFIEGGRQFTLGFTYRM